MPLQLGERQKAALSGDNRHRIKFRRRFWIRTFIVSLLCFAVAAGLYWQFVRIDVDLLLSDSTDRGSRVQQTLGLPWRDFPARKELEIDLQKSVMDDRYLVLANDVHPYLQSYRGGLFAIARGRGRTQWDQAIAVLRGVRQSLNDAPNLGARQTILNGPNLREAEKALRAISQEAGARRWPQVYNLGVIAFWNQRFSDAASYFESASDRLQEWENSQDGQDSLKGKENRNRFRQAWIATQYAIGVTEINRSWDVRDGSERQALGEALRHIWDALGQVSAHVNQDNRTILGGAEYEAITFPHTDLRVHAIWNDLFVGLLRADTKSCPRARADLIRNCPEPSIASLGSGLDPIVRGYFFDRKSSGARDLTALPSRVLRAVDAIKLFWSRHPSFDNDPYLNHNASVVFAWLDRFEQADEFAARARFQPANGQALHKKDALAAVKTIFRLDARQGQSRDGQLRGRLGRSGNAGQQSNMRKIYINAFNNGTASRRPFNPLPATLFTDEERTKIDDMLFVRDWRQLIGRDAQGLLKFIDLQEKLTDSLPGSLVRWKDSVITEALDRVLRLDERYRAENNAIDAEVTRTFAVLLVQKTTDFSAWTAELPWSLTLLVLLLVILLGIASLLYPIYRGFKGWIVVMPRYKEAFQSNHYLERRKR